MKTTGPYRRPENAHLPKGVRRVRGNKSRPWGSAIKIDGRFTWLGSFATPEEAGRAFEAARARHPVAKPDPQAAQQRLVERAQRTVAYYEARLAEARAKLEEMTT